MSDRGMIYKYDLQLNNFVLYDDGLNFVIGFCKQTFVPAALFVITFFPHIFYNIYLLYM